MGRPRLVPDRGTVVTGAEAWQQCSARGTTVTRLAYIVGFTPLLLEGDRSTENERDIERDKGTSEPPETPRIQLGVPSSSRLAPSFTSSSHLCSVIQLEEQLVLVTLSYTLSRIVLQ